MATKTSLLGLTKPAYTEAADIAVLNTNFDLIDKAVGQGARGANLLDNSDFRNPINQRGNTSYSGARVYCIDRWMIGSSATTNTCTVTSAGISFSTAGKSCDFEQLLEHYSSMAGGRYTIAYKDSDGVVYCLPFTMGNCGGSKLGKFEFYSLPARHILFRLPAEVSATMVWAALYEGEYTADTLPAYVYKGYAAELAECQRYYRQSYTGNCSAYGCLSFIAPTIGQSVPAVHWDMGMRTAPTVTIKSWGDITENAVRDWSGSKDIAINGVAYPDGRGFSVSTYKDGSMVLTPGKVYAFHYTASADL